jgi:hypothetical protein
MGSAAALDKRWQEPKRLDSNLELSRQAIGSQSKWVAVRVAEQPTERGRPDIDTKCKVATR